MGSSPAMGQPGTTTGRGLSLSEGCFVVAEAGLLLKGAVVCRQSGHERRSKGFLHGGRVMWSGMRKAAGPDIFRHLALRPERRGIA